VGRAPLWLRALGLVLAIAPAVYLAVGMVAGAFRADPFGAVIRLAGQAALALLLLSLGPTAWRIVTGSLVFMPMRSALGLAAFAYASAHVAAHLVLDYGGNLRQWLSTLPQDRFAIPGVAAWLLLTALAATSGTPARRILGSWQRRLHRLVYLAALLAVIHMAAVRKEPRGAPLAAAIALLVLCATRLPPVARALEKTGRRA
jgi:sulfoxide reductase heme-binding subunit YedZ